MTTAANAMVARIDDSTAHFKKEDLKQHRQFDFALQAQMCWSKNVLEEHEDAPADQILLGSMDTCYCILLAIGIYLEVSLRAGQGVGHGFLFGHSDNGNTNKATLHCNQTESSLDY